MQSSYSVIKNNSVKNAGLKQIVTNAETAQMKAENENNAKNHIESYENLAKTILENARKQGEQIKAKAYEDASAIEYNAMQMAEQLKQEAYESAFSQGHEEGYNSGIEQVRMEGEAIIASATDLLINAKSEYEQYLQSKSEDIKELVITISRAVLKRELQSEEAINEMVFEALQQSKGAKNFIIRCSAQHVNKLREQIDNWKEQLGFFGDIFVLKDDTIELGNAVIDKGNGKIITGVDYALQRIIQILEGKD